MGALGAPSLGRPPCHSVESAPPSLLPTREFGSQNPPWHQGRLKPVREVEWVVQAQSEPAAAPALQRQRTFNALLRTVSTAVQHAGTLEDAFQATLHEVCFRLGWPVAQLYILDPGSPTLLISTKIRHLEDPRRLEALRQLIDRPAVPDGVGLRHRALAKGGIDWIFDVTKDPTFLEAKFAAMLGVRAAIALPIKLRAQVIGVIEFFAREPMEPDADLMDVLRFVGDLLGWTLHTRQAEEELRRLRAERNSLLRVLQEGVYGVAADGRIAFFNTAGAALLGYGVDDLVGHSAHEAIHHSRRDGSPFPSDSCPLHGSRERHQSLLEMDEVLWRRDGTPLTVKVTRLPPGAGEEADGALIVFRPEKPGMEPEEAQ